MSVLLQEGIGDTIRVSLTPEPGGSRSREVIVAQEILQTMGLRAFMPMVIACPGCGRTTSTYFQQLAQDIQTYLREQMPVWRLRYPGVEEMDVADLKDDLSATFAGSGVPMIKPDRILSLAELEEQYIAWVIEHCGGNKTRAAELLGIDVSTVYRRRRSSSRSKPRFDPDRS